MPFDQWEFDPPPPSELGDRQVPLDSRHLVGKRIALLVTGGIAAMKAPLVARALRKRGADVQAFASVDGLRYVTEDTLAWSTDRPVITRLTPAAEHLSDDNPFDAYLLAPATYNSINKIRHGIADGVITSAAASALGRMVQGRTQLLVAPTMHGSLHTPILTESLRLLAEMGVRIIPPREDYGKHNIPSEMDLVVETCRAVSRSSLKGKGILVTGGPTPVPLDDVRRLTSRFRGTLGIRIAEELLMRGADVELIHGYGGDPVPDHLPHALADTFDDYRSLVLDRVRGGRLSSAIFTAAVADYRPKEFRPGKIPSGGALASVELVPTPKVIREVQEAAPELHMTTFKLEQGITLDELMEIAGERLEKYPAVVANLGDEVGLDGAQVAYLLARGLDEPVRMEGKPEIAHRLADHLEVALSAG